jgi:hypothetical protein
MWLTSLFPLGLLGVLLGVLLVLLVLLELSMLPSSKLRLE